MNQGRVRTGQEAQPPAPDDQLHAHRVRPDHTAGHAGANLPARSETVFPCVDRDAAAVAGCRAYVSATGRRGGCGMAAGGRASPPARDAAERHVPPCSI